MSKILHIKIPIGGHIDELLISDKVAKEFIDDIKKTIGDEYIVIVSPFEIEVIEDSKTY